MPFVNVKLVEGIVDQLGRAKAMYESIDGHPVTRPELADAAPVVEK